MKKLLLLLLMSQVSYADAYYLDWGTAFDYPGPYQYSDIQVYSGGTHIPVSKSFDLFCEVGGWKDQGHYKGSLPGMYVTMGPMLDLKMGDHFASYSLGLAGITSPDTLLGSHFEIFNKLSLGYMENNKRIGVFIKHLSDAGMSKVNYGRNFVGAEVGF